MWLVNLIKYWPLSAFHGCCRWPSTTTTVDSRESVMCYHSARLETFYFFPRNIALLLSLDITHSCYFTAILPPLFCDSLPLIAKRFVALLPRVVDSGFRNPAS